MNVEGEFQNCNIDIGCTIHDIINREININVVDVNKPTKFTNVEIDNLEKVEIEEIVNDDSEILTLKLTFFLRDYSH